MPVSQPVVNPDGPAEICGEGLFESVAERVEAFPCGNPALTLLNASSSSLSSGTKARSWRNCCMPRDDAESKQLGLILNRRVKDSDDNEGVLPASVPFAGCAEKEVEIFFPENVEIHLTDFGNGFL